MLIILLESIAGGVETAVWDPAANGVYPPLQGEWAEGANWTPGEVPGDFKAVFNIGGQAECLVSDVQSSTMMVAGDNGDLDAGLIRIISGGSLTTGRSTQGDKTWSAIGYNRKAKMIVETGGTYNAAEHLWIGYSAGGQGTLVVNGGKINVEGTLGLGWSGGTGYVYINGGSINISGFHETRSISGDSCINIKKGMIVIEGNYTSSVYDYASDGKITGYDGTGEVVADYDQTFPGKTTIMATALETDPPTPNPALFAEEPRAISDTAVTMTAAAGSDLNEPLEYFFDEITENPGGSDSGWVSSTTYTDSGLEPETLYSYTVKMRDAAGNEGQASPIYSAYTWTTDTVVIVWDPQANGIFPPETGSWGDSQNWTSASYARPEGNFKCVFNRPGAAEAVVTGSHFCRQIVQGDGGEGGIIRIAQGGNLTTGELWTGIGYNYPAKMIIENDGVLNTGGHLWIGLNSGGIGTLEINGGEVNVSQNFSLGWNGGNGIAQINEGTLNLSYWAGVNAIKGRSKMDISNGVVIIGGGDQTGVISDFISEGRITAFGGTGKVIYDYNITNPGKNTIRAIDGVAGDFNNDGHVNGSDLEIFSADWLVKDCGSEADLDSWCTVDYRDYAIIAANWLKSSAADWQIEETLYTTDDYIVTPYRAENFGIVADGVTDVTDKIQAALISISNLGGGALFLPEGKYKVSGNLTIPSRVTLRGDWQKPTPGSPITGTIIMAYAGRANENAPPFISLSGSSGVKGISVWYPEQEPDNIQPYPPTFQRISGSNFTLENVTFVNCYFGFTSYQNSTTARPFLRNIYGTPLKTGIEYDCLADIGRIESVHFSPAFWAGSALPGSPTSNEHASWIYNNGTGLIVRRIDWSYSCYVTVEGYNIGFALRPSRYDGKHPNGQSYDFTLKNCKTGIYVQANAYAGYQFTRFDIQNAQTGVFLSDEYNEATMFHTCSINAESDALYSKGPARVLMMSCHIQQGAVRLDGGYISVINSNFSSSGTNHIELAEGVHGASILGNTFAASPQIVNNTIYPVHVDHRELSIDPLPAYDYKKPDNLPKPSRAEVYVVTEEPYNAASDGSADAAAAFQSALNDAGSNGGGIVFVPGGNYSLYSSLNVPTGVELRGIFDTPHETRQKGSLINIYAGRNNPDGTPFIQLSAGSGLRGLTFHYPEQVYDGSDTLNYGMVPYPFLIRGLGCDVYAVNLAATIPYQLLDLATHRCDRHYIDYILSTALKTGIHVGGGSTDGQIHNCQFNPSAYTHQGAYYESIPYGTADNIHKILWRDAAPYLFGNMNNQILHENFVFGGRRGFHLVKEGTSGPSGYCLGMGVDQCTNALQIDHIGIQGLDMINSQIVTVNGTSGRYLETGPDLESVFRMFCSAGWGTHQYSAVINGGDVRLQLFHLARDAEQGTFKINENGNLHNLGGNLSDYLSPPRPFLSIDQNANGLFIGNIINTSQDQMPANTNNVTSIGNLRIQ
ncbi:glycosyl hydrolase family 28-related protein [Limihaloglobus sulfuriphilus]|uniref:glycosyl hydrolase family 28-related protein n=1 Tax=Limihaloglobus sulfuriphilus TaxID=1851148 RepID=UPI001649ECF1|nr:glycosyl hydrolase family 28-related protein [Limihaloglobus sulfuriphilus]